MNIRNTAVGDACSSTEFAICTHVRLLNIYISAYSLNHNLTDEQRISRVLLVVANFPSTTFFVSLPLFSSRSISPSFVCIKGHIFCSFPFTSSNCQQIHHPFYSTRFLLFVCALNPLAFAQPICASVRVQRPLAIAKLSTY